MFLSLNNVSKTYFSKTGVTYRALKNINLSFEKTGLVFIVGPSGSGKSTLLNIIGGLDSPTSGDVIFKDIMVSKLKSKELEDYRNSCIGFVFQDFNLLKSLDVFDNVSLSQRLVHLNDSSIVNNTIDGVLLNGQQKKRIDALSGGQKQRVAIARSLVKNPDILIADEPTGALDFKTSREIMEILKAESKKRLVIIVTHDAKMAHEYCERLIEIKDGFINKDLVKSNKKQKTSTSFITSNLVYVKKGEGLDDKQIEQINEYNQNQKEKRFLFFTNNISLVDNLIPSAGVNEVSSENNYLPYQPNVTSSEKAVLKPGKIPTLISLKIAFRNLVSKKLRLLLLIIFETLSILSFSLAISVLCFNTTNGIVDTTYNQNCKSLSFVSLNDSSSYIQEDVFTSLVNQNLQSYKTYSLSFPVDFSIYDDFDGFDSVIEVDDVNNLGYKMYAGSSKLSSLNSIIISQYAATKIKNEKVVDADDLPSLVGKNIKLNGILFFIDGIFESETSFSSSVDFEIAKKDNLNKLFVKSGFVDEYIANAFRFDEGYSMALQYTNTKEVGNHSLLADVSLCFDRNNVLKSDNFYTSNSNIDSSDGKINNQNEIVISKTLLERTFGISQDDISFPLINEINEDNTRELSIFYNGCLVYSSTDFFVDSVLVGSSLGEDGIVFSPLLSSYIIHNSLFIDEIKIVTNNDKSLIEKAVVECEKGGLKLNASYTSSYYQAKTTIFSLSIYFYLGVGFISLFALVILSFFSFGSINYNHKEIGVLRAIGVKKKSAFSLFAIENLIITIIALSLSIIFYSLAGSLVNLVSTNGSIFIVIPNIFSYLIMVGFSLVVTIISLLLPYKKYSSLSPLTIIKAE